MATRPARTAKVAKKTPARSRPGAAKTARAKVPARTSKPAGKTVAAPAARPTTVAAFLASLPPDRRAAIQAVREVILANLDKDFQECIQYGGIGYSVPHRVYPAGYHCDPKQPLPFAGIMAQKNHMSIHMMSVYASPTELRWFTDAWAKSGKKLDMGRSCVRFKKIDDVPLEVIGEAIRRVSAADYIALYERGLRGTSKAR